MRIRKAKESLKLETMKETAEYIKTQIDLVNIQVLGILQKRESMLQEMPTIDKDTIKYYAYSKYLKEKRQECETLKARRRELLRLLWNIDPQYIDESFMQVQCVLDLIGW